MPPTPALDVYCAGELAGSLARSDLHEGEFLFGYAADCPQKNAVSLTMPVVRDQYDSMNTVPPIFEMNLPEGALLEKLRLRFAKATPCFDDLHLLEIVGQSQIGRLRYARAGAALAEPAADRSTTHIVKSFDANEYSELAANEYFCTRAAIYAGLPTTQPELAENRSLLVAKRFDLREDGSYLGVEDFCVLNALRSHDRYDGSYELVAKRIREFVSPAEVAPALEQLFVMVALCCAIENGDAHLKNFAVVYEDAQSTVRLAPAYDLVCTTVYEPDDSMALTLNGSKAFPTRKVLESFGRLHCDLQPARIRKALQRVTVGVTGGVEEIRAYAARHEDFAEAADRLIARFNHGLQRLGLVA